jgi:hypothetical protein
MKNLFVRISIDIERWIETKFGEDNETSFVVSSETLETVASRPNMFLFLCYQVLQA